MRKKQMSYYPMWKWPWRACLLAGALLQSLWRDWFPPPTCRTCRYCAEPWPGQYFCTREIGVGYGRPTRLDATCKRWKKWGK